MTKYNVWLASSILSAGGCLVWFFSSLADKLWEYQQITLKQGASKEELEKYQTNYQSSKLGVFFCVWGHLADNYLKLQRGRAKEAATSSGGKITDVYTLIKGFA